jgi:predicted Fe-Mo cluster-binding NifX family protein
MVRVGIPVFESRVSPVLDTCRRMLVVDIEAGIEVMKIQEIALETIGLNERVEHFCRWGIQKIICGGVSELMCKYLEGRNIDLISGIAGDAAKVVKAFICKRLDQACFRMPGAIDRKEQL